MIRKWLVTLDAETDVAEFRETAKKIGCETSDDKPIRMSDGESVVAIDASLESKEMLQDVNGVRKISPSSEMGYL